VKRPNPSCPLGYTITDINNLLSFEQRNEFFRWMDGQTVGICEGRIYNYETKQFEPDECAGTPHGSIIYVGDLWRYLDWSVR